MVGAAVLLSLLLLFHQHAPDAPKPAHLKEVTAQAEGATPQGVTPMLKGEGEREAGEAEVSGEKGEREAGDAGAREGERREVQE
eukprot:639258-Rhodomonas_salina.1